jgi:hypothetical protein
LQCFKSALTVFNDAVHAAVPHAFKIQVFDVSICYTKPAQEPTGLKAHRAAKDKASSVSAVEAVPRPTLFGNFKTSPLSGICTLPIMGAARRIEADPP